MDYTPSINVTSLIKIKFGVSILDYFLNFHGQCKYMYQLQKSKNEAVTQ